MKQLLFFFVSLIAFQLLPIGNIQAAGVFPTNTESVSISEAPVEQLPRKSAKKKKKKAAKDGIKEDEKPFPLFALLSTLAGFFSLGILALGVLLQYPVFIPIIAGVLAIGGLILGIMALKRGEAKTFSFVGIMLSVVGILGTILICVTIFA